MSKYTLEQLKEMARTLVEAKNNRDPRYTDFVLTVAIATRTSVDYVVRKINEWAA